MCRFICMSCMSVSLTAIAVLLAGSAVLRSFSLAPERVLEEVGRLERHGESGGKHFAITFPIMEFFGESTLADEPRLDLNAAGDFHFLAQRSAALDVAPVGLIPTWVFPPTARAPRVPPTFESLFPDLPETLVECVPPLGSDEYKRLSAFRNRMYGQLAEEFPEIQLWMVGFEPNLEFLRCDGKPLSLDELIVFAVDSLQGVVGAIREVSGRAQVLAHFLGRRGIPIERDGRIVQPEEMMARLLTEIAGRGQPVEQFLDDWASTLDPGLLAVRGPGSDSAGTKRGPLAKTPGQWMTARTAPSPDCTSPPCRWEFPLSHGSGWVVNFTEEFDVETNNVTTYPEWRDWYTTAPIGVAEVDDDRLLLRLSLPPSSARGISATLTEGTVEPVAFDPYGSGLENSKWVAVNDFFATQQPAAPSEQGAHVSVSIRVNPRDWDPDEAYVDPAGNEDPNGYDNTTRFVAFVYGGDRVDDQMNGIPNGAIQFTSDNLFLGGNPFAHVVREFPLAEHPWLNPTKLYRIQMQERRYWDYYYSYELRWKAYFIDVSNPSNPQTLSSSTEYTEWQVQNQFGMHIPILDLTAPDATRVGVGWGPGRRGGADVEFTGTAYWNY